MDETSDEDDDPPADSSKSSSQLDSGLPGTSSGLQGVSSALGASMLGLASAPARDFGDMSASALHLYDMHLSQVTVTPPYNLHPSTDYIPLQTGVV